MTALTQLLIEKIASTGPITLAEYMADCLMHPQHGYYATRDPFGASGDFTTAPEISQMFGELIGLTLAQAWLDQGRPSPFTLAEFGPGRGTLMADILRSFRAVPGLSEAAQVHLIEASPHLRKVQRATLGERPVTWLDSAADLPNAPLFLVANEFFDALPIRQFQRAGDGWQERLVAAKDGALGFALAAPLPLAQIEHRLADTQNGDIVEICPAAPPIMDEIAQRIASHGGAALIIDYGDWRSKGDTFQALEAHQMVDPFLRPGQADLTAHVDFEPLATTAKTAGVNHSGMTTQGVLLERIGITARAQNLAKNLTGKALTAHIAAHRRLTHPEEMGTLFKSIALSPVGVPPLAGLDP